MVTLEVKLESDINGVVEEIPDSRNVDPAALDPTYTIRETKSRQAH